MHNLRSYQWIWYSSYYQ